MISLVLSGGVGSRLWPISREKLPKQFSPLFKKSLFAQTVERQQKLGQVMVCTGQSMRQLTESSIRRHSLNVSQVFYEPVGKNTAPAIALACRYLELLDKTDQVLGVFPSDHWIRDQKTFFQVLKLAEQSAERASIVTIGLKPTYAATGFGYIELENDASGADALRARKVLSFKEKPDQHTANQYLDSGDFVWNSGMFVFRVDKMIGCFEQFMPQLWNAMQSLDENFSNLDEIFSNLESQSIDYGVMEKTPGQLNIPCDIGWSDLGSWDDIASLQSTQVGGLGETMQTNAKNNYFHSEQKKLACFSEVDDLLVIDTEDALLVTRRERSQSVKDVFEQLKSEASWLTTDHTFEYRPWGMYRNLYEEPSFKAKVIEVDPKQQLSYQSHAKRSETWIVVQGVGEVVLNDQVIPVQSGSVIQIKCGDKHRMRNSGESVLKFVEVQLGDYFGEDDIQRFEDDYQRT